MFGLKTYSLLLYLSSLRAIGSMTVNTTGEVNFNRMNDYGFRMSEFDVDINETTIQTSNDEPDLPAFFDARIKWGKMCHSLGIIGNQGGCKSGWAMAIATVITDRRCIATSGGVQVSMSPMMLLSCCPNCCGCAGKGNVVNAWKFARDVGLMSGSLNQDFVLTHDDGCQPYMIKPLRKEDLILSSSKDFMTPTCFKHKCTNPSFREEKLVFHKIKSFKFLSQHRPDLIMRELMTNGPLQVSFNLYEDFRYYKGGENCSVYSHEWGKYEGQHAAKLVGWGTTENNKKYWLLTNSFGYYWGCKGMFKVSRKGKDNMHFGFAIVAPQVYSSGFAAMSIDHIHVAFMSFAFSIVFRHFLDWV